MSGFAWNPEMKPREYQTNIYKIAKERNSLIVLPTGLGKTFIAAMVAKDTLEHGERVLFLAPTKPLVSQHFDTLKSMLQAETPDIFYFTGEVDSLDRRYYWTRSSLIVSTPQLVWNDMRGGELDISTFSLIIFDEAHRATGNYAYTFISREFQKARKRLILAMTASPGGTREKLDEIRSNLGIEEVILKSDTDPDVAPYVGGITVNRVVLELPPELREISRKVRLVIDSISEKLKKSEFFKTTRMTRKELASLIPRLIELAKGGNPELFGLIPYATAIIRLDYVLEYIESQGPIVAFDYLKNIMESDEKSLKRTASILSKNPITGEIIESLELASRSPSLNPKLSKTLELCEDSIKIKSDSKVIVFSHYRRSATLIKDYLSGNSTALRPVKFVGQSSREGDAGMSQKEQDDIITRFRSGEFNVLVATSVAEEGLDIPTTDRVIFFEPVPSEIRSIQRRGRTGRLHAGEVFILMYSDTRDTGYYYSSQRKEKNMGTNIGKAVEEIRKERTGKKKVRLDDYF